MNIAALIISILSAVAACYLAYIAWKNATAVEQSTMAAEKSADAAQRNARIIEIEHTMSQGRPTAEAKSPR